MISRHKLIIQHKTYASYRKLLENRRKWSVWVCREREREVRERKRESERECINSDLATIRLKHTYHCVANHTVAPQANLEINHATKKNHRDTPTITKIYVGTITDRQLPTQRTVSQSNTISLAATKHIM